MPLLGIEIGGTKLQLVLGDRTGKIKDRHRLRVDASRGAKGIQAQIEQSILTLARGVKLGAVGVGFGGPVDWKTGKICRSHQIEGWSGFDLGAWVRKLTGAPVAVDNDANVAALGEALHGAGRGFDPVFYVTLGSGVGGGLVTRGTIYHGATPGEAEIGHVRLDRKGTTVESRCSGWAVDKRIREAIKKEPNSRLAKIISSSSSRSRHAGEAQYLPAGLKKGDRLSKCILTEVAEDLAFGLSHAVHLFHPEVIILGGGLSKLGTTLCVSVQRKLSEFVMHAFLPAPQIRLAALGEDAVPVGALALAGTRAARAG
jgi:glucokinase